MSATRQIKRAILERLISGDDEVSNHGDERQFEPPAWRLAYREAAAVLSRFDPRHLVPFGQRDESGPWYRFLPDCEPVEVPNKPGIWRLKDPIRRETLKRLGSTDAMRAALDANPDREEEPIQRAIERLIEGNLPELRTLRREDLAALAVARDWFTGIIEVPSEDALRSALPIADVLAPLQKLAAECFVGRKRELTILAFYVGHLRVSWLRSLFTLLFNFQGRKPLFIYGPGGVGKSALVARFILEHIEGNPKETLPFVYLDIDRPVVDPQRPLTLLIEATTQLAAQFPDESATLRDLADDARSKLARYDLAEGEKSLSDERANVTGLASWVASSLGPTQPVLLVVDTFEEAQFLGPSVVDGVWGLLSALQAAIPNLRIVVAGRAPPGRVPHQLLALRELDDFGARALVRKRVGAGEKLTDQDVENIVTIVGRNPMSLRLAAEFVKEQGISRLQSIETHNFFFLRLKTEKIQAQLYGRILGHIHDEDVRKLAYPGFIVRRITPAVIREVLAGPCGIELSNQQASDRLFDALAEEVALIERDGERALKHRLDVRRMMLGDLLSQVPPETVMAIDRASVGYYETQSGVRARAEEIYHRLRLAEAPEIIEKCWMPGVEEYLRNALEELLPPARLWLSQRLGVTPDAVLLAQADLETWEELTLRSAQQFLQVGNARGALEIVTARKDRSPASPLYRVEAEALRLMGQDERARGVARRGIDSAAAVGNTEAALDLMLLLAALEESAGRLQQALDLLENANRLVDKGSSVLLLLRLYAARIRVRRSLGPEYATERHELMREACCLLTPDVLHDTRGRPALLRELVAELGGMNLQLLRQGLEVVGLELDNEAQRQALARALEN